MGDGNRWHSDQENNMCPDVKADQCPWCGSDSIVVDTTKFESEHLNTWEAQASCHECGSKSPDTSFAGWEDHPLFDSYLDTDSEVEREAVNLAVKIWNYRK